MNQSKIDQACAMFKDELLEGSGQLGKATDRLVLDLVQNDPEALATLKPGALATLEESVLIDDEDAVPMAAWQRRE